MRPEPEEIIRAGQSLLMSITVARNDKCYGDYLAVVAFLRAYAGEKSSFYRGAWDGLKSRNVPFKLEPAVAVLESYLNYVRAGFLEDNAIERGIQVEVISDYLAQAEVLLRDKKVHPAAPAVIIGASLEEFLRTWVEEAKPDQVGERPTLDSLAKVLRKEELITKQDMKDITSWAGIRNSAAHGQWQEVEDRQYVLTMLQGVNLFMRKHARDSG